MAWVEVTRPFSWRPQVNVMLDFKPGLQNLTRACADHAVRKGFGVRAKAPKREEIGE